MKSGLIPSMVAGVSLQDLMIKDPITVGPNDDIEIAAQLFYKHKIGGMPVVEEGKLAGIITESDILRAFIDMMGILTASSRIDVTIGKKPGLFKKALQIISDQGGDIINVSLAPQRTKKRIYYFRLTACKTDLIKAALEKEGFEVVDAMD
jgi:acetoin utilization protein AcuB